jgi:hypothetical protein
MTTIRSEIVTFFPTDAPADYCTNTVWHDSGTNVFDPATDFQNHANELRDLFTGQDTDHPEFNQYHGRHVTVKCYDWADPKPRPVRGMATYVPSSPDSAGLIGPRQVAVVLSYYGTRNLVHQRGHIYIGPLYTSEMGPNPDNGQLIQPIIALGHGLFDIGGENVAHVVHSEKLDTNTVVQNYWVDNRWDTQRRRLPKATGRTTLAP